MRTATENMRSKAITILPIPLILTILPLCNLPRFQNFLTIQLAKNTMNADNGYHVAGSISVKATCKKIHFTLKFHSFQLNPLKR